MTEADDQDCVQPELRWLRERAAVTGISADLAKDWRSTYAYVRGYQMGEELYPGSRERAEKLEAAAMVLHRLGYRVESEPWLYH